MRPSIREFVAIATHCLPIAEPVYEFGSLQVEGQEGLSDLRPLFGERKYVGADMREGPGVDRILNLHNIDLPSESAAAVLCMDTLEHVEYPHRALQEIHRVLLPDGIVVISSVMNFPIHDYPYDYWRFTPEAFRSLLKPFSESFVEYAGRQKFPHTVVGIGFKGVVPPLTEFKRAVDNWRRPQTPVEPGPIKRGILLATPPVLLPLFSALHRAVRKINGRHVQAKTI